jgi:hypothetical protein
MASKKVQQKSAFLNERYSIEFWFPYMRKEITSFFLKEDSTFIKKLICSTLILSENSVGNNFYVEE